MKKMLGKVNIIFLVVNIILFLYFAFYTILGSNPIGNYITDKDIQIQLVISIIYEFVFFAISLIAAKILKNDLSYKGIDVLSLVPKFVVVFICLAGIVLSIYSLIVGISVEFTIMTVFMLLSILLQIGISKYFCNA